MRLSRGCYDKFHRCPGWAGGGPKYPRGESRCQGGHIQVDYEGSWRWKFWPCNTCNVVVWPYVTRWLSVPWWTHQLRWWWSYDVRWWWQDLRNARANKERDREMSDEDRH